MRLKTLARVWTLAVFLLAGDLSADTLRFSSGDRRVNLVELYTSEGCSSCPPAEAWLNNYLDEEALWKRVIPLAFHVDYWDYIGWQDRFAQAQFSRRQYRYQEEGGIGAVYTPGVLVNGKEWRGGLGRRPPLTGEAAGVLTLEVSGERVSARFQPESAPPERLRLHLAVLAFGLSSEIGAGENRGRRLAHEFVVVGMEANESPDLNWQAQLPGIRTTGATRHALVGWVSRPDRLRPLQAAGGWLPAAP